jgi:rubrerythrin
LKRGDSVIELVQRQKRFEQSMVKAVEALEGKVHNSAAKLLLAELRLDSTKHASICEEILSVAQKTRPERLWDAKIESFVDMQVVKKELEMHIKLEETMLKDVEKIIAETPDEAIKTLFTHIAEDERKHHKNIRLIIDKSYAFGP